MKIDLGGRTALVAGAEGPLADAISQALRACGANVTRSGDGAEAHVIVAVSTGAESGPVGNEAGMGAGEAESFTRLARIGAERPRRMIFVISAAALVPVRGAARFSSQQAGLASLAQGLAMELAPTALVNAIAVGGYGGAAGRFVSHTALRRPATGAEIVPAALFLADPRNTYTTGHVMAVDGGWSVGYARNF